LIAKNQNDSSFQRFLQPLEKNARYIKQHPEETWQLFAKTHPESNDELNHRAWIATLPNFTCHPEPECSPHNKFND